LTGAVPENNILAHSACPEEVAMPQYNYFCQARQKEFSKTLTLVEYEKGRIVCPNCGSKNVEQRWVAFYAVTSKKS
jgi:DNA-directed RNA polymerase subunit RPC12/RpoP